MPCPRSHSRQAIMIKTWVCRWQSLFGEACLVFGAPCGHACVTLHTGDKTDSACWTPCAWSCAFLHLPLLPRCWRPAPPSLR